jgi:hypothetical protein
VKEAAAKATEEEATAATAAHCHSPFTFRFLFSLNSLSPARRCVVLSLLTLPLSLPLSLQMHKYRFLFSLNSACTSSSHVVYGPHGAPGRATCTAYILHRVDLRAEGALKVKRLSPDVPLLLNRRGCGGERCLTRKAPSCLVFPSDTTSNISSINTVSTLYLMLPPTNLFHHHRCHATARKR